MNQRKKKKLGGLFALTLAVVMILGSSLAYFTDRASTSANGTAGTVDIALNPDIQLTDADGKNILNPGDARKVNFTIPNVGNKSVDIREIIKLTSSVTMTNTETQAEFELYKTEDVEEVTGQGWRPKSGATPLAVRTVSDDKKTITYQIPDVVLDGNHESALGNYETEPEANGLDTQEERYTLLFRQNSSNAFQDATVTIEKLVDAKQHRNTNADWTEFVTEQYVFQNGDQLSPSAEPTPEPVLPAQAVILYSNGDLVFQPTDEVESERGTVVATYDNINTSGMTAPWSANRADIKKVVFEASAAPTQVNRWFYNCTNLETVENADRLDLSNVTSTAGMFQGCTKLASVDTGSWNVSNVTDMNNMFTHCDVLSAIDVANWDTSKVANTQSMFSYCKAVEELDTSNWNTDSLNTMNSMFFNCNALKSVDVSDFDTSRATDLTNVFFKCNSLESVDVSQWDISNVTSLSGTFYNCPKLTTIDVSRWNTENVQNLANTFGNCTGLTTLNVSNWDTADVTNMSDTFNLCKNLTAIDVSGWSTANVTTMSNMFGNCQKVTELDLSSWNTANVTNMEKMFVGDRALATIYASDNFVTTNVDSSAQMFESDFALVGGGDTAYDYTKIDKEYARIGTTTTPGYFKAKAASQQPAASGTKTMIKGSAVSPSFKKSGYLYNAGTKTEDSVSGAEYASYDVVGGNSYYVNGSTGADGTVYPLCAFYDSEGNRLSVSGQDNNKSFMNVLLKAPASAVRLVVNGAQKDEAVVNAVENTADYDLNTAATLVEQAKANPFTFNDFNEGYVTFVVDDLECDVDSIASTFEEYGYPVVLAAPPSRLDVKATALASNRGNYTPGMAMRDIMAQVVADGGEIMTHNFSVVTADNQDDYDFMYKYFVTAKKELQNAGFNVRGLIRAGGVNQISGTEQIEKWLIGNYDYSNMGTAVNYSQDRVSINRPMADVKASIDDAVNNKTWTKFMVHGYNFGGGTTFTNENDLRKILDYCKNKGVKVVTYAYMFDTYGNN